MIVKLDFERVYPVNVRDGNENEGFFYTRLRGGREKKIAIRISSTPHELVDDAYNLAFGPVDRRGRIKDMESLQHADYSIVFSTILNFAKGYIDRRPGGIIGLDGSTNSRAYL
uniref:DUF6934 family protein n=1 Tax=Chitinophaga sp. TaxID=1869181 RepID=UPI0031E07B7C